MRTDGCGKKRIGHYLTPFLPDRQGAQVALHEVHELHLLLHRLPGAAVPGHPADVRELPPGAVCRVPGPGGRGQWAHHLLRFG